LDQPLLPFIIAQAQILDIPRRQFYEGCFDGVKQFFFGAGTNDRADLITLIQHIGQRDIGGGYAFFFGNPGRAAELSKLVSVQYAL